MAQISRLLFARHLRSEPNQYILHYRRGKLVRQGAGLAYWFHPLSAAVAQVPVQDIETTFVLNERTSDFQEVTIQATIVYRCADALKAAQRINFSISLTKGVWLEQPLERLANVWAQWAQEPARSQINRLTVVEAVRSGAQDVQAALEAALAEHSEMAAIGLSLVSVQVDQVVPAAELEKALQTPTRESIQQKADEATFSRRALAVEKERAIKENELATEIQLARQQEALLEQQGANRRLEIQQEAEAQKLAAEAQVERELIAAEGLSQRLAVESQARAEARQRELAVETATERQRVEIWRDAPSAVNLGFALQRFADKVQNIQHLNVTPDLLGDSLQRILGQEGDTE